MKHKHRQRLKDFARSFIPISATLFIIAYLILGLPLLDLSLLIMIGVPIDLTPGRDPRGELLPSTSVPQAALLWLKKAYEGFGWTLLFYSLVFSLVVVSGYKEWLTLRYVLVIINLHCWMKYFHLTYKMRRSR